MRKIFRKSNIKIYLIYYLIVEALTKFSTITFVWNFLFSFIKTAIKMPRLDNFISLLLVSILILIIYSLTFIMLTLPVTLFLLARKSVDIEKELKNKKYTSRQKVIYYRDKLNGISPTTISLMQNIKIEEEKDLIATLLKLQLMGNIVISGNEIIITSDDTSKLLPSEEILFNELKTGKLRRSYIEDWKKQAVVEAKAQGYLKEKKSSKTLVRKKIILVILCILSLIYFMAKADSVINTLDGVLKLDISEDMSLFDIPTHKDSEIFIDALAQVALMFVSMIGIFGCPVLYFIFHVMYKFQKDELKRTYKGEALTDEILGMKRFLHDFSMLDEANKELIGLWDEFLIYAVALGENEKIVEDILNIKNIKISDMQNIINN